MSFDHNPGSLDLETEVEIGIGGDNIEIDAKGDIWIAAHPQLLKFVYVAFASHKKCQETICTVLEDQQEQTNDKVFRMAAYQETEKDEPDKQRTRQFKTSQQPMTEINITPAWEDQ
jgi:hypothetical protein